MSEHLAGGAISIADAPHYTWGSGCDGWHLLQTGELSVIEERMPPATSERRHRHARAQQFFYVLAGELTLESGGVVHRLRRGEGLAIAPWLAHQAINDGDADVRFLVISQPPSHGDRVES